MMTETTQDSLNVRLAKWAGWTNIEEWETWSDNAETGWCSWKALRGTSPDGIPEQWLPDYAGSLDAGMALVPCEYSVTFGNAIIGGRYCVIDDLGGNKWSNTGVYAATDSAALAHTLDAMRQQEDAK